MATVTTLLADLGNSLNDPNEEVFTQALKLTELNNAQLYLVIKLLGFGTKFNGIYDLLSEIVEMETKSIDTSGFDLSSLTNRNFMNNGLINTRINLDGIDRFPVRYALDDYGLTENSFLAGSDDFPVIRIDRNKIYLDVSVGRYPLNIDIWYVGEPYTLATSASGNGKTQSVATPDLNIMMHDLIALIAQRRLLIGRGDLTDIQQAALLKRDIDEQINALARGQDITPKSETLGQFNRMEEDAAQR